MFSRRLLAVAILPIAATATASPVEYDTPDYHLVVSRPFDSWSGDRSVMEGELDAVRHKRAQLRYTMPGNRHLGAGMSLLGGTSSDSLTVDTVALVESRGFEISQRGGYHWEMGLAAQLDPGDYPRMRAAQSGLYDALIRAQGDPDKVSGSMAARRVLGNLLAVGAIGAGLNKFGTTGAYVVTTAFAGDISQLPVKVRQAFVPFDLPALEGMEISKFEVYPVRVNEGGSPGQVLIAFKAMPTDEVRHTALVQALASLSGSDATLESIEAARAADLQRRKATWAACLAAHQCGATADEASGETK